METKVSKTRGAWSRSGTVDCKPSVEVIDVEVRSPQMNVAINIKDQIIEALRSQVFKRGVTYKEIAKRFDVKESFVFKIRKDLTS